jgi:agmatinase
MTANFETALARLVPGAVATLGLPLDENSSFMRGSALAPPLIREALTSGSSNLSTELGVDLDAEPRWIDAGDLTLSTGVAALDEIEAAVARVLERGARVLSLGGDHSVTYPILRAYARSYPRLTILHLDAHPDLYDEFEGNRYSHASPFARIMEEGLATRLVQVGIRTMSPPQRLQVERFGVEVVEMRDVRPGLDLGLEGPLYLSIDLDALDPAFAPGVSHHEPGGLTTREVLGIVHAIDAPLVGADVVEYNPRRDVVGMTAMLAAKLAKEIAGRMLERR